MNLDEKWTKILEPKKGFRRVDIGELWRYRDLVALLVRRTFVERYKQTVLGPLWAIVQPLLTTLVFTVVFGRVARLPTDGVPDFLFYMGGSIIWGYFSYCLSSTSKTFLTNARLFGKVYFPRLVMPIAQSLTALISFGIQFLIFALFLIYYCAVGAVQVNLWALTLPLLLAECAALGVGCGILVSALTVKYRDLAFLVGFGLQLWLYLSPVTYPAALVSEKWRWLFMLNPMAAVIETFRSGFFSSNEAPWGYLLSGGVLSAAVLMLGVLAFGRVEKSFTDTV